MEESTAFVGREHELRELPKRLAGVRLLTLTGPGGSGKTRLALRLAEIQGRRSVETAVASFAELSDPQLVPQSVALALGVREQPGVALGVTLRDALARRRLLLVMDNCEHVLEAAAELVASLLGSSPGLRVLATSRRPLGVGGEAAWPVSSMPVTDAVRLFVERARVARPAFDLSEENEEAVVEICRRLDGLPLAIELAAARIKALSARQIADRLDERFRLLETRGVERPHRTLRSALDWSYELLGPPERRVLRALSLFPSGASLDALASVTGGPDHDLLDEVTELIDRSLVQVAADGGDARYKMLETVRAYAREKLEEAGEHDSFRPAYEAWALGLAARAEPELSGAGQSEWLERIDAEHENLRAVLRSSAGDVALRLAASMWRFWQIRGYLSEGRAWLDRVLGGGETAGLHRIKALNGAGALAWSQGDYEASVAYYTEVLDLARRAGDDRMVAIALNNLGSVAQQRADFARADTWFAQSAEMFRTLGDEQNASLTLVNLGAVAHGLGDLDRARRLWDEALAGLRRAGFKEGIAHALNNLASVALHRGDRSEAAEKWNEALGIFRLLGNRQGVAQILHNLGMVAVADRARALYREGLAIFRDLGDRPGMLWCIEGIAISGDDKLHAARLFGAASTAREEIGAPIPPPFTERYESAVEAARDRVGAASFDAAWKAGTAMALDEAADEALARPAGPARPPAGESETFRREGEYWTISFRGRPSRLKDAKGLRYIATLLARPNEELHAIELAAEREPAGTRFREAGLEIGPGDAGELIDTDARTAYRQRLAELRHEENEAREWGDPARAEGVREEIEAIEREVARGVGLGGRERRAASPAERARLNVTRAIRSAIDRIASQDRDLADHLRATIKTGTFCSYAPDPQSAAPWTL